MTPFQRKTLLVLFCINALFSNVQTLNAQHSSNDSLRQLLTYFKDSTRNQNLKPAIDSALTLYTSGTIDDLLAKKLLTVQDSIVKDPKLNQQKIFLYTQNLVRLFNELSPKRENINYATACIKLAVLYSGKGQYNIAETLLLQAKQIREKIVGKQHPDYASVCHNLAIDYRNMGQYEKALPLMIEAKELRGKVLGKDNLDYARSCNSLANLYSHMGEYEKAEPLYIQAKIIFEKAFGKENIDYAFACNNLALLYGDIGQYENSEKLNLEVKQIWEKLFGKSHPNYAITCNNLANLYSNMDQYKKAEQLYFEAKQIWEKTVGKEHPNYATSCNNLADVYMDTKQFQKAKPLYIEAKEIRQKVFGNEHPAYATACYNLGGYYVATDQFQKAESLYLESKQIRQKILGTTHPHYGFSRRRLAEVYWLMRMPLKSEKEFEALFSINAYNLSSVFQFTNEKEKAAFIRNILGEDEQAFSFYISQKVRSGLPYSIALFHRNLILSSSQALKKEVFLANDTVLINKYNEWIKVKDNLSALYSKPVNEKTEEITKIEEQAGFLEKDLVRISSQFKKQQRKIEWRDIQENLKPGEAAIEFVSFHFDNGKQLTDTVLYAALVLRKDSLLPVTIFLFNEKKLSNLLSSTGNKITTTRTNKLYTPVVTTRSINNSNSLYQLIWKPLEKELKGIKTVYFAPSGLLHKISFAALPVNTKEVLSDRYNLVQLATTAAVADQQPSLITSTDKIQLYGGINYHVDTVALKAAVLSYHKEKEITRSLPDDLTRSGGWNDLPGTRDELEGILSLSGEFKSNITSLSGIAASEESFKSLDGAASPAVIHIATHGFFYPDPKRDENHHFKRGAESGSVFKLSDDPLMRSGLLFAGANQAWQNKPLEGIDDGILTAYEVSNLYLPNTKLVVLSACETGLGDIQGSEGVYGLQRAFKMAGAENLVMSLWKVPDPETAEFMQNFYKNLFAKQSISDAFHKAQEVMKNKYRFQPYKWAAWVLVR